MILTHARFQTWPACNLIVWFRSNMMAVFVDPTGEISFSSLFLKRSQVKLCYGTAAPTASVPLLHSSESRPQCRLKQKLQTTAYNHFDTFFFFGFAPNLRMLYSALFGWSHRTVLMLHLSGEQGGTPLRLYEPDRIGGKNREMQVARQRASACDATALTQQTRRNCRCVKMTLADISLSQKKKQGFRGGLHQNILQH